MTLGLIELIIATLAFTVIIIWGSIVLRDRKRQNLKDQSLNDEAEDILIGTLADLEQAEKDVAELNLEEKLIETHQLVETFNTMHGFDTNYIEQLVRELSDIGVDATYLFKHTMPTGTMSYTGHSGIFELFVNKEAVEKAQAYIKDKLAMKSH